MFMSHGVRGSHIHTFVPIRNEKRKRKKKKTHTHATTTTTKKQNVKPKRPILNANIFYSDTNEIINICRNIIYDPRFKFGRFLGCRRAWNHLTGDPAYNIQYIFINFVVCKKKTIFIYINARKKHSVASQFQHIPFVSSVGVAVARRYRNTNEIEWATQFFGLPFHCAISIVNLSI